MTEKILIADDDDGVLSALKMLLRREGYDPTTVDSPAQVLQAVRKQDFAAIVTDLNFSKDTTSGDEGLELVAAIRELEDLTPIVVMTGWGTIDIAVRAMKVGADDFIQKPWDNDLLLRIIRTQARLAGIQRRSRVLAEQNLLLREQAQPKLIAEAEGTRQLVATLHQVADSQVSVLLTGENGTGKTLFANYLHEISRRSKGPMISVNMGAISEGLFESEMFGHVRGAFTGADSHRIGRFELAHGGTLFLDEIANTPLSQQSKLLRVLEDGEFERVGSSKTREVDVRLIVATNTDLPEAVREGRFRQDLLYRINMMEIHIPPLRDRPEDILPLAESFMRKAERKYSKAALTLTPEAQRALTRYSWPGNVRELGHVIERACLLCGGAAIQAKDLGVTAPSAEPAQASVNGDSAIASMEQLEADIISRRLEHFGGDAAKAASSLGLSRSAFYRRVAKIRK